MFQCVILTAGDTCSRDFIILTIQHEECVPKNILAAACRGSCTSYSRPSTYHPGQMERFCQCCDADEVRLRTTTVRCPVRNGNGGRPQLRNIRVNMNLPRSCRCRPCSEIHGDVIPAEHEIWNQGKRSSVKYNNNKLQKQSKESELDYLIRLGNPFIYVEDNLLNFTLRELG